MRMSDNAYKGLCKLARKTGMDCWFSIQSIGNVDVVFDLEYRKVIPLKTALIDFVDGITDPIESYGLDEAEVEDVLKLFALFGLYPNTL